MKILHVFHNSDLKNGVDKTTCTLITALKSLGSTCVATVPALGDASDFLTSHGIPFQVIPYPCCKSDAWRAQLYFLAESSRHVQEMINFIEQHQPDIIHLNTGHLLHAGLAAAKCKIPTIWHIHAPFDNDLKRYQSSIGTGGYRWILDNLSSHVIGVSNDVSGTISTQISNERVSTLYNGIDIEALHSASTTGTTNIRNELNLPDDAQLILGVGRISAQKDFATFARIAHKVVQRCNNTFFAIAGPKHEPKAIELLDKEVEQLALSDKLFILGPRSDVPALVAQSSAFLSTAIFEGQGIAALEAMALQKPVVAMACQGLRECIQDGVDGLLVEPGDETAAVDAVVKTLNDQALSQTLGENGLQSVSRNFSSKKYGSEFLDIAAIAVEHGPAIASADVLELINGLLNEIDKADQRLRALEQQTFMQRLRLLIWQTFHPR